MDSLKALNPRLVYCSITGFGQNGPYAQRAGYDFMIQGMAGVMSINGTPDGEPMKMGVAFSDIFAGLHAVIAFRQHCSIARKRVKASTSTFHCWTRKWPCWPNQGAELSCWRQGTKAAWQCRIPTSCLTRLLKPAMATSSWPLHRSSVMRSIAASSVRRIWWMTCTAPTAAAWKTAIRLSRN